MSPTPRTKVTEAGRECTRCHKFKPWSDYNKNVSTKTGYQSACRTCILGHERKFRRDWRIEEDGRECSLCGVFKRWNEFSPNPRARKTKHFSACKLCRNGTNRTVMAEDPKKRLAKRAVHLSWKFGIRPDQYWQLHDQQHGLCALCGEAEVWTDWRTGALNILSIDHDHLCQNHAEDKACPACIRGLCCNNCNRLLGFAEKRLRVAVRFADYLALRPLAA